MLKITKGLIVLIFGFLLMTITISSCEEEPEEPDVCTGCTANEPWSKAGAGTCYTTQQDCEAALGATCVICN